MENDPVKPSGEKLLALARIQLHHADAVKHARELVIDDLAFPFPSKIRRSTIVHQRHAIFVFGGQCLRPDQRRIDQLLAAIAVELMLRGIRTFAGTL